MAFELPRAQVRGRAAAQKQGVDGLRRKERGHLLGECVEVGVDEVVLPGGDGEVAVAAVVGAERNVDVGGAGPEPGGRLDNGGWD